MKQLLHKSKFASHHYCDETKTLFSDWFQETGSMKEEDFKNEMEIWIKVSKECRPERIFDRCIDFTYPISPENQTWMAQLLNPGWIDAGVKKYAHLVPEEFIANLSVYQMFDEFFEMKLDNQFEIEHFSDEIDAFKWLGEKEVIL